MLESRSIAGGAGLFDAISNIFFPFLIFWRINTPLLFSTFQKESKTHAFSIKIWALGELGSWGKARVLEGGEWLLVMEMSIKERVKY